MKKAGVVLLILLAIGYIAVCVVLYIKQDAMVFDPRRESFEEMEAEARGRGFEPWLNAKGERIGWQSTEGNEDQVLLGFSGQAGNALDLCFLRDCCKREESNWKTYLMEYPGYGSREGKPSEKAFTAAAVEAVDMLTAMPGRKIWLVGQSMGSGTACATVRERGTKIAGVLLLTPFNSLVAVAKGRMHWIPVSLLLRTRFRSDKNLAKYPGPVAIFISGKDTVVPPALGQKLYDGYRGKKRLWVDPESDHDVSELLKKDWGKIVEWLEAPADK